MKLDRLNMTLMAIQMAIMLCVWTALAAGYQTYRKDRCEWDNQPAKFLNKLDVHHFFNQAKYPQWKNVEANTVTLHHKCQFVFHKCNFTNCVPETCVLFGRTVEGIIKQCEKETGIDINGNKITVKE